MRRLVLIFLFFCLVVWPQRRSPQWVVILESPPIAKRVTSRTALATAAAQDAAQQISLEHGLIRAAVENRGARYMGSSRVLLNAVFFTGTEADAASLRSLPGVYGVVRSRNYRRLADDQAANLVNAPGAWSALGGEGSAGLGRRIGILDSGIDHTHPTLQDDSLPVPDGFPRASRTDYLSFTSKKVIVARSYVEILVDGDNPDNSRPDDVTPLDRGGHGTAVAMLAAGLRTTGPAATVTGIAPKASLGNYKVFGSPGVNDFTTTDVLVAALNDALADGMDVVTLSLGAPADWGPLDTCGPAGNQFACDPIAITINNAANLNLSVVVAAGNDGDVGFNLPTFGSINTPGTAPDAITVGAITNGQIYFQSARVQGNPPAQLQRMNARFGNGPVPTQPLTKKITDVTTLSDDGNACRPLGNGTLTDAIALISRGGNCTRADKVTYAERAGAVGVLLMQFPDENAVPPLDLMEGTGIPMMLIGDNDGKALKAYLQQNPNTQVALDPALIPVTAPANEIAYFSSRGPSIGEFGLKPELTAVGTDLYTAAQSLDPNGELYSADRYRATQGTSFSVPMVAGAVALVKQKNPTWNSFQLKSAVVNTANPTLDDFDSNGNRFVARVTATGAGKLDAAQALTPVITADPATVSFFPYTGTEQGYDLRLTNTSGGTVTLTVAIEPRDAGGAQVSISPNTTFSLAAGQTTQLSIRLSGARPAPGNYEGVIRVTGAGTALRIPYLYLVGDGVPYNIYALFGNGFVSTPGAVFDYLDFPLEIKVLDRFGVPVAGANVAWTVVSGTGRIDTADQQTDSYGVATAGVTLGQELGEQAFRAAVAGVSVVVSGRTVLRPTIDNGGVVNAGSFNAGQGMQPGSYISIFGAGLSDVTRIFSTPYLPLSLAKVSVSFDAPEQRLSVPGRIHFVRSNQINVQIPWEFTGLNSVRMKVSIGNLSSAVYTVPLNTFSPGIFEYDDAGSGRRLAAARDEANNIVSGTNPVERGKVLQLFVNGLGAVTRRPPSGEATPSDNLSETTGRPDVTIGGRPAAVQFSGLAPGLVGCYQVNVVVPSDAPTGLQPLALSIGGQTSQMSSVPVR